VRRFHLAISPGSTFRIMSKHTWIVIDGLEALSIDSGDGIRRSGHAKLDIPLVKRIVWSTSRSYEALRQGREA
jgi:hypothetical protein